MENHAVKRARKDENTTGNAQPSQKKENVATKPKNVEASKVNSQSKKTVVANKSGTQKAGTNASLPQTDNATKNEQTKEDDANKLKTKEAIDTNTSLRKKQDDAKLTRNAEASKKETEIVLQIENGEAEKTFLNKRNKTTKTRETKTQNSVKKETGQQLQNVENNSNKSKNIESCRTETQESVQKKQHNDKELKDKDNGTHFNDKGKTKELPYKKGVGNKENEKVSPDIVFIDNPTVVYIKSPTAAKFQSPAVQKKKNANLKEVVCKQEPEDAEELDFLQQSFGQPTDFTNVGIRIVDMLSKRDDAMRFDYLAIQYSRKYQQNLTAPVRRRLVGSRDTISFCKKLATNGVLIHKSFGPTQSLQYLGLASSKFPIFDRDDKVAPAPVYHPERVKGEPIDTEKLQQLSDKISTTAEKDSTEEPWLSSPSVTDSVDSTIVPSVTNSSQASVSTEETLRLLISGISEEMKAMENRLMKHITVVGAGIEERLNQLERTVYRHIPHSSGGPSASRNRLAQMIGVQKSALHREVAKIRPRKREDASNLVYFQSLVD